MTICDICGSKAICKVLFTSDDQRFDLCQTHKEMIVDMISSPQSVQVAMTEKTKKEKTK